MSILVNVCRPLDQGNAESRVDADWHAQRVLNDRVKIAVYYYSLYDNKTSTHYSIDPSAWIDEAHLLGGARCGWSRATPPLLCKSFLNDGTRRLIQTVGVLRHRMTLLVTTNQDIINNPGYCIDRLIGLLSTPNDNQLNMRPSPAEYISYLVFL